MDFVKGKKKSLYQDNIELEVVKIAKRLEEKSVDDLGKKEERKVSSVIERANNFLKETALYDLLDHLQQPEALKNLQTQELWALYKISVRSPVVNQDYISIDTLDSKIQKAERKSSIK